MRVKYLIETGNPELIDFKLHDFGFRGVSSNESAGHGAAAHLTQFKGTDTLAGLLVARHIYGEACAGFSIPASEHSTITSWGKDGESDAFGNMLKQYPTGLVACVSDSWDIFNAIKIWGTKYKKEILTRDGTLVIRPDSGHPPTIDLAILQELEKYFPVSTNEKGYKVLDDHVRIIQGDGIDYEMIIEILEHLKVNGWSADNIAFGSGGGLLQKMNRDTLKCAFKCSLAIIDDHERFVYKDPITDPGKRSKKGYITLHQLPDGSYETRCNGNHGFETDVMQVVFRNGRLFNEQTFGQIRERSKLM